MQPIHPYSQWTRAHMSVTWRHILSKHKQFCRCVHTLELLFQAITEENKWFVRSRVQHKAASSENSVCFINRLWMCVHGCICVHLCLLVPSARQHLSVPASGFKYLLDVIKTSPTQQQEIYREKTGFDPILYNWQFRSSFCQRRLLILWTWQM